MYSIFLLYLEKGGIINGLIACVCFVVIYLGFSKLFMYAAFRRSKKTVAALLETTEPSMPAADAERDWLVNAFLKEYRSNAHSSVEFFRNKFRELLLEKIPQLEDGLNTMAAWISVAPLLGLLGTVVGMVKTFSIITQFGVGNPNLLSEGISVALLTTQSGLIVAFPCLLFHNYLLGRKNVLVKELIADAEKIVHWVEKRKAAC